MGKQVDIFSGGAVEPIDEDQVDRLLLRYVGTKSTTEIARELGMAPHEVKARITVLLDNIDVLTIQQERHRLMVTLNDVARRGQERLDEIGAGLTDREWAQVATTITTSVKIALDQLARMEAKDDEKVQELNALRVQELLRLMDAVVTTSVKEIADRFLLNERDLLSIFTAKLSEEAAKMDMEN